MSSEPRSGEGSGMQLRHGWTTGACPCMQLSVDSCQSPFCLESGHFHISSCPCHFLNGTPHLLPPARQVVTYVTALWQVLLVRTDCQRGRSVRVPACGVSFFPPLGAMLSWYKSPFFTSLSSLVSTVQRSKRA